MFTSATLCSSHHLFLWLVGIHNIFVKTIFFQHAKNILRTLNSLLVCGCCSRSVTAVKLQVALVVIP
jgi:hypothetical protein